MPVCGWPRSVSTSELLELFKALGLGSTAALKACSLFDRDQDGQVTEADFNVRVATAG